MGGVFILMILVLGYHYTSNYLPAKVILKRSSGWEAYVHLGKYGFSFLFNGIFSFVAFLIFLKIIQMILNIPFHLGANYEPLDLISWLFNSVRDTKELYWYYIAIFIFAFIQCSHSIKTKKSNEPKTVQLQKHSQQARA